MIAFAHELSAQDVYYQYKVGNTDIVGYVDFLVREHDLHHIVELKATNEFTFEHVLQVLIYEYLIAREEPVDTRITVFNALKGVRYEV